MKRIIYAILLIADVAASIFFIVDVFVQVDLYASSGYYFEPGDSTFFSILLIKLMAFTVLSAIGLTALFALMLKSHRKAKEAVQLEKMNNELIEKQYALEEQNALVEELNSQLEEQNYKYYQQKEVLHTVLDSLGAGILMTDNDGSVVFINEAWKSIYKHLRLGDKLFPQDAFYIEGVKLKSTEQILEGMVAGIEDGGDILAKLYSMLFDNHTRYNIDMEQTKPVKRFLNLYSNPCVSHNNTTFGRVFVVRDISHQKEVDKLKLELISTVSHELRTPMSSIMGFSELLLTRELSEERKRGYMSIINSEARRLTNLINDFLDIQRMETGKQVFNKQMNSIDQIVMESIKLFEDISDKHKIIYHKNTENIPPVYCDRDKILQVVSNLLSNAIKYSPEGGEVKVELELNRNRVKIGISDRGLGIPEDGKEKLFTKFFRIDNDDRRKIGGTGLGLAICKEIMKAHGGVIDVESTYGQGSTFFFCLPCEEKSLKGEAANKLSNNLFAGSSSDLLIVEDDECIVKLIMDVLENEGLNMHSVRSGEEALQLLSSNSYKLVILDIALSGHLNGWDVLKQLKCNQETANIPIIVSSVYENKDEAVGNNIADYLVKPFEPEQLIKMVRKALNGKLDSKLMINSEDMVTEVILDILNSLGICVKHIDHSGNMVIITLEGEEGYKNE